MSTPFWGPDFDQLADTDPDIAGVVLDELARLRGGLQLIASENLTSPAVLAALGSTLSNKYAEGYPGRRYYGGCQVVDRAEEIGIARAKELFGAEHANLQPHSGTSANFAVYAALLTPGDTVLAMSLPHGGHLTHGSKVSFSGKWFGVVYGVREDTEFIDYDQVRDLACRHRPKMIICGATAYPRLIDFAAFRSIADEVGSWLMVDAAHFIGLVAGGVIPSPVPYADVVSFTTHKVLRGPRGGMILAREELAARIDKAVFPFSQGGPLMHAVAPKAVALREAANPRLRAVRSPGGGQRAGAGRGLGRRGHPAGRRGHRTPTSRLLDLRELGVSGRDAEARCDAAGITLNKNAIPYDPQPPAVSSGIRVGTPAVTTQGMGESEMKEIAALIARAVRDPAGAADVAAGVATLVERHPAYPR